MSKRNSRYTGDLLKPMEPSLPVGLLATDEERTLIEAEREAARSEELFRRLDLLFNAHRVERYDWIRLTLSLAITHVPGFATMKAKRGRKKKWHDVDRAILKAAVQDSGLSIAEAVEQLAGQEPWKSKLKEADHKAKTLRDMYDRADDRIVKLLRMSRAYDELTRNDRE